MVPRAPVLAGLLAVLVTMPIGLATPPPDAGEEPAGPVAQWLERAATGSFADCGHAHGTRAPDPDAPAPLPEADILNPLDQCPGIRPGARLGNGCTMNFVFTDGASLYIGTAGHCTSSVGQRMSSDEGQFGSVVYRINSGLGRDFALIRIDANKVADVSPVLCAWGGPNGVHSGPHVAGTVLYEYGWGVATQWSSATRARAHVAQSQSQTSAQWIGEGSGGDSGAPLIDRQGRAYAIHTHGITPILGVYGESGTYIQQALSLARGAGFNVNVVTV